MITTKEIILIMNLVSSYQDVGKAFEQIEIHASQEFVIVESNFRVSVKECSQLVFDEQRSSPSLESTKDPPSGFESQSSPHEFGSCMEWLQARTDSL